MLRLFYGSCLESLGFLAVLLFIFAFFLCKSTLKELFPVEIIDFNIPEVLLTEYSGGQDHLNV